MSIRDKVPLSGCTFDPHTRHLKLKDENQRTTALFTNVERMETLAMPGGKSSMQAYRSILTGERNPYEVLFLIESVKIEDIFRQPGADIIFTDLLGMGNLKGKIPSFGRKKPIIAGKIEIPDGNRLTSEHELDEIETMLLMQAYENYRKIPADKKPAADRDYRGQ